MEFPVKIIWVYGLLFFLTFSSWGPGLAASAYSYDPEMDHREQNSGNFNQNASLNFPQNYLEMVVAILNRPQCVCARVCVLSV